MLKDIVVIGVGNEYRSDDIVGLLVVRKLKELFGSGVDFYEHTGEGTALIELWQDRKTVFLVDAIYSKDKIGAIYRVDLGKEVFPKEWFYSTHAFNIAEAIELAKILGQLPENIMLYGITANSFAIGTEVSTPVYQVVEEVVRQMVEEINRIKR